LSGADPVRHQRSLDACGEGALILIDHVCAEVRSLAEERLTRFLGRDVNQLLGLQWLAISPTDLRSETPLLVEGETANDIVPPPVERLPALLLEVERL
jgi:hypothetical protein